MKKYIKTSILFMKVTFLVFLLLGLAATTWSLPPSPPFSLPSQTGHTGKFLTTNGSVVSWAAGGVGDVTGVGDCADGACLDGTSDGGTYIRMYDGNSHYSGIQAGDSSANLTFILPISALVAGDLLVATSANQLGVVTDVAVGQVLVSGGVGAVPAFTANPSFSTANIVGTNALTLGTSRTSDGVARFKSGTALNDFYHTIQGSNFAANTTWTLPTAVPGGANYLLNVDADGTMDYTNPGTFAGLTAPVFVTSIESPFLILGSTATAADAGAIRMANATSIAWEYPGGTGTDTTLTVDASDDMVASLVAVTDLFKITTGNLFVGAGTPGQAQDGADAYVTGMLEVDGMIYADGGITSGSISTAAGNITATSGDVTGSRVIGTSTVSSLVANVSNDTPATAPSLDFWRARAASANVADDDVLGEIRFKGQTAGGVESGAIIRAVVNGTPGSGDLPTELILATSADGSATPTTRMTINALGSVIIDGAQLKIPSSNADPTATAGYLRHDSTVTNHADGAVRWHDGTNIRQVVDMVAATAEGCTNGYVVAYNSSTDLWYCKDDANTGLGTAALASLAGLTETAGGIPYGTADNAYAWLAAGATTTILVGGGAAAPVWTTATGSGAPARATSPVFVTPTLGAALGTSLALGVDPAAGGTIMLTSSASIKARNSEGTGDVGLIAKNPAEAVLIASEGASGVTITPNTTVTGTLSAGAAGFSVDADGDVTGKSFETTRAASDQFLKLFESTGDTGDDYIQLTATGGSGASDNATWSSGGGIDNMSFGTLHLIVEGVTSTGATGTGSFVFHTAPTFLTSITVGNAATGPGSMYFKEDSDNGTNTAQLIGPDSTADVVITLPAATGTVALVKNEKLASFGWDGGGSAVATAGSKRCVAIPYAATIVGHTTVISGDPGAGGTILNITKDAWSDSALPTTEIDASAPPTVADDKVAATDSTLTGWTKTVAANDIICADVATNLVATWISLTIFGTK